MDILIIVSTKPLERSRARINHQHDSTMEVIVFRAGLIKSCWSAGYKARPGAAEVAAFLAEWPRLLAPCLDVPLDALALDPERDPTPWRLDRAEVSAVPAGPAARLRLATVTTCACCRRGGWRGGRRRRPPPTPRT